MTKIHEPHQCLGFTRASLHKAIWKLELEAARGRRDRPRRTTSGPWPNRDDDNTEDHQNNPP